MWKQAEMTVMITYEKKHAVKVLERGARAFVPGNDGL